MGALDGLQNGITNAVNEIEGVIGNNPIAAVGGAVAVGALGGAIVGSIVSSKTSNSKTRKRSRKKITHTRRGWKQDRARRSKQKWEVAYRKRKAKKKKSYSRSSKRKGKHYTKNGQPYIILASGKARFVKKHKR